MRISLDTKAKVKVGDFSRGGKSRKSKAVAALDHDMGPSEILVPLGILELTRGTTAIDQPWLLFGQSKETSDFIADGVEQWWSERRTVHSGVKKLQIELDNGPAINSHRTQFMKRMIEFVDEQQIELELVYLPPYHSKYNPIERYWGVLEQHWNGELLSTISCVEGWASTSTWRGNHPLVRSNTSAYESGVRLTARDFRPLSVRLHRTKTIEKWSLTITVM